MSSLRLILCLAALLLPLIAWEPKTVKLPDGPGKELVEKTCADCHGLDAIVGYRLTQGQWRAEVDDMIAKGAKISDPDFETIVQYLVKNFGREAAPKIVVFSRARNPHASSPTAAASKPVS
jgi:mono/diheme cytochrome c family protein